MQKTLNANLAIEAKATNCTIAPVTLQCTGEVNGWFVNITSISGGKIELGAYVGGSRVITTGSQITAQLSGVPGGPGLYALFADSGRTTASSPITVSYGVMSVGSATSGSLGVGQMVTGPGVAQNTAI